MKKIAIITGGTNPEREISLLSATNFYDNLDKNKYIVEMFDFPKQRNDFLIKYSEFDLVIPLIHGIGGENGELTNFCNTVGKKYLFSDAESHMLCINKYLSSLFLESYSYLIPKTFLVTNMQDLDKIKCDFKIFVKPCNGGSSVDNGVFNNLGEAKSLIEKILKYDEVLIQEYIKKQREFTVSIIGDYDKNPEILAISEIITDKELFDYEAKYESKGAQEIINAQNLGEIEDEIKKISLEIYKKFKIKTFSRIDFIYSNEKLYFLEVNTIPGFTKMSFLPQSIISKGYKISDFLDEIIKNT